MAAGTRSSDGSLWHLWMATAFADGHLTSMESFELDRFDAAQRRYRELTASPSLPLFANEATRLLEDSPGPSNEATRLVLGVTQSWVIAVRGETLALLTLSTTLGGPDRRPRRTRRRPRSLRRADR